MIRISGFEEHRRRNLFLPQNSNFYFAEKQRRNKGAKKSTGRSRIATRSSSSSSVFAFSFEEKKEKEKESSGARLDLRWWTATYSKCERMQISSLMSGIFKEAERWMEHAAGTGQYDDICIWYIIQSTFLPPTMAACAAHKPPCRSHEIRLPGKSPFFSSSSPPPLPLQVYFFCF